MPFARPARRVLLVGLDAAEWDVVRPLASAGRLPNLERLIDRGLSGTLVPTRPTHSAALWTSIATGHRPDRHGVYDGRVLAPAHQAPGGVRPAGHLDRAAHAVWTILTHRGLRAHCVGWPATHPAEATDGVFVSDAFVTGVSTEHGVTPPGLTPDAASMRLSPSQIHPATLEQIVGPDAIRRTDDPLLGECATLLAEAVTTHNAATAVLAGDDWDFAAVHYAALGRASRLFMPMRPPTQPHVPPELACYGGVVDAVYAFVDLMLGRLVELAGDDTAVLVVSGHGFATGDERPAGRFDDVDAADAAWHRNGGMCVFAGPPFKADDLIENVTVFDLAPTVLTLLGLPVAADAPGRPLLRAMREPVPTTLVASWEAEIALPPESAHCCDAAWQAAAPLIAAGRVDRLAEQSPAAVRTYLSTLLRRAQSLTEAGRAADAAPLLDHLTRNRPDRPVYHAERFTAAMAANRPAAARQALADAVAAGHTGPLVQLGWATVEIAERQPIAALERLSKIDAACAADVAVLTGEALARLGRWQDAAAAFETVLKREPANEKALLGLAKSLRRLRRYAEASEAIARAIARRPQWAAALVELAVLHDRQSNPAAAHAALLRALALDPFNTTARQLLSRMRLATSTRVSPV